MVNRVWSAAEASDLPIICEYRAREAAAPEAAVHTAPLSKKGRANLINTNAIMISKTSIFFLN